MSQPKSFYIRSSGHIYIQDALAWSLSCPDYTGSTVVIHYHFTRVLFYTHCTSCLLTLLLSVVAKDALDERVWKPSVEATPPLPKEGDVTNPEVGVDDENIGLPYPVLLGCPLSTRGCK